MAQAVEKALEELQENITILDLGANILNTLIIFTTIFLFTTIFNISNYYALVPAAIYFFAAIAHSFYYNKYIKIEEKVPELKEQLRTAADNLYKTNPIIDSLKEDVTRNITKVKTSDFIDTNSITIRILYLTIISIIIVIVSFKNVNLDFNLNIPIFQEPKIPNARTAGQELVDLNLTYLDGNIEDILGKGSIARLGTQELQLIINPLESDADINHIKKVRDEDFNPPTYPKEIYTTYDIAYNEKIAKENQKIVKNYFEQIIE